MARSREVSKPRDSGLDFSNRFEIWQERCRDACQISERCDYYNTQSRDFTRFGGKTSYSLVNWGPELPGDRKGQQEVNAKSIFL